MHKNKTRGAKRSQSCSSNVAYISPSPSALFPVNTMLLFSFLPFFRIEFKVFSIHRS